MLLTKFSEPRVQQNFALLILTLLIGTFVCLSEQRQFVIVESSGRRAADAASNDDRSVLQ